MSMIAVQTKSAADAGTPIASETAGWYNQMEPYLSRLATHEPKANERPAIRIILCASKK